VILIPAGYWRVNLTTDVVFPCDSKRASCIGEINRTPEEAAVRISSLNYYCSEGKSKSTAKTSIREYEIIFSWVSLF